MSETDYKPTDAMIAAARERWPEMVEEPQILAASPGSTGLEMALDYQGTPDSDLPSGVPVEHIALEDVGPYRLGYGPRSGVLYVGQAQA